MPGHGCASPWIRKRTRREYASMTTGPESRSRIAIASLGGASGRTPTKRAPGSACRSSSRRLGVTTFSCPSRTRRSAAAASAFRPSDGAPFQDRKSQRMARRGRILAAGRGRMRTRLTRRPRIPARRKDTDSPINPLRPRGWRRKGEALSAWTRPPAPVHALFASSRVLTPKVRAFIDLAREHRSSRDLPLPGDRAVHWPTGGLAARGMAYVRVTVFLPPRRIA